MQNDQQNDRLSWGDTVFLNLEREGIKLSKFVATDSSRRKRKSPRQFHQLQHLVNVDIHTA